MARSILCSCYRHYKSLLAFTIPPHPLAVPSSPHAPPPPFSDFNTVISRLMNLTNANIHAVEIQRQTWGEQIKEALTVNGGDVENATNMDYVMHFVTFFWKVLFSLVPPTGMLGGWPCFFVSLGVTGVVTAIVGDLASIFGCLVGLRDSVTGE